MAKRNYEKLGVYDFGKHLLRTEDLDPVYCALFSMDKSGMDRKKLSRWLIAYWCYYHCGAASYLSEFDGKDFWKVMKVAASNVKPTPFKERWPRGHERRHLRGDFSLRVIDELEKKYGSHPEGMIDFILEPIGGKRKFLLLEISNRVKEHFGFGPWIAFKVADMLERVLGEEISFTDGEVFMFTDPVKGASLVWRRYLNSPGDVYVQEVVNGDVVSFMMRSFKRSKAPPSYDRIINIQEVETILCKWKSHLNGHYPLYNDIDEIRGGLQNWISFSDVAREFLKVMPIGGDEGRKNA